MSFEIEKNIPQPKYVGAGNNRKYPFNEMKPGDSFLINGDARWKKVSTAAGAHGKRYGQTFSVRNTPDGYRCWRIT